MSHLLLEKAFKYRIPDKKDPILDNYIYDVDKGYWVNKVNDHPLVYDNDPPRPRTKKEDIETGEDRKGE